jgi:hypothetical protein
MIKGFSLLEVILALTLTLGILSIVISNVSESTSLQKKITTNQQNLESIFHTVDMIKQDLTKCGMRLGEASLLFGFPIFENTEHSFKVVYGVEGEVLQEDCWQGDSHILINKNDFFSKNKKILIFSKDEHHWEFNKITKQDNDRLILSQNLEQNYRKNANVVVIKEVEYKIYPKQRILKRKVNSGYFQPLIENVTDFYIKYYPESSSVLYRLEINQKEQVRGYIFLINAVPK